MKMAAKEWPTYEADVIIENAIPENNFIEF